MVNLSGKKLPSLYDLSLLWSLVSHQSLMQLTKIVLNVKCRVGSHVLLCHWCICTDRLACGTHILNPPKYEGHVSATSRQISRPPHCYGVWKGSQKLRRMVLDTISLACELAHKPLMSHLYKVASSFFPPSVFALPQTVSLKCWVKVGRGLHLLSSCISIRVTMVLLLWSSSYCLLS